MFVYQENRVVFSSHHPFIDVWFFVQMAPCHWLCINRLADSSFYVISFPSSLWWEVWISHFSPRVCSIFLFIYKSFFSLIHLMFASGKSRVNTCLLSRWGNQVKLVGFYFEFDWFCSSWVRNNVSMLSKVVRDQTLVLGRHSGSLSFLLRSILIPNVIFLFRCNKRFLYRSLLWHETLGIV